jgi:hypothetical protein
VGVVRLNSLCSFYIFILGYRGDRLSLSGEVDKGNGAGKRFKVFFVLPIYIFALD